MLAGLAYGFHFGVRAGIECRSSALDAFTHDFVAADDQRANRGVAGQRRAREGGDFVVYSRSFRSRLR
jgi:hypothetical protein